MPSKEFYWLRSNEVVTHSDQPSSGIIDTSEIQKRNPKFWISRTLNTTTEPKDLIITDFFIPYRSQEDRERLKSKLITLLKANFRLFLWHNDTLVSLTQDNLSLLDDAQVSLVHPSEVIANAVRFSEHHLTKDSIKLLDDYEVNRLLEDKEEAPQEHVVYASLWNKLNEPFRVKALELLTQAKIKVTQFIDDVFPHGDSTPPDIENIKTNICYKQIIIDSEIALPVDSTVVADGVHVEFQKDSSTLLDVLNRFSSKIGSLKLSSSSGLRDKNLSSLKSGCLKALKTLTLHFSPKNTSKDEPQLNNLLAAAHNLKTLNLSHCKTHWDVDLSFAAAALKSLESLTLNNCDIPAKQLDSLFKVASNIKSLNLSSCKNLDSDDLTFAAGFNSLESLTLSGDIPALKLARLLKAAPKLKVIDFVNNSITDEQLNIILEAAPKLEGIHLRTITDEQLNIVLNVAPKLKILRLSGITVEQLERLSKTATELESLDLSDAALGNNELSLAAKSFGNLKTFTANLIKAQQLKNILQATPVITFLDLSFAELDEKALLLAEGSLKHLETLWLTYSAITFNQFYNLLIASRALKFLYLSDCAFFSDPDTNLSLVAKKFRNLNTLTLTNTAITPPQLSQILQETPYLENLYLSGCKQLANGELSLAVGCLGALKTLDIHDSTINARELDNLLLAAPNLTSIRWDSCSCLKYAELSESSKKYLNKLNASQKKLIAPSFDPKEYLTFTRKPPKEFIYKPHSNQSQGMIIAKLSKYLIDLDPENDSLVRSIQSGICSALSYYFIHKQNDFDTFLSLVNEWDPETEETPTAALADCFNELKEFVEGYQLQHRSFQYTYLGQDWLSLIQGSEKPMALANPWHMIALKPLSRELWEVYDPNYLDGRPQTVSAMRLKETIKHAIGEHNVTAVHSLIKKSYVDHALIKRGSKLSISAGFLREGGLHTLCSAYNATDIIALCNQPFAEDELSDGLFLRNLGGAPAWYVGQRHTDGQIQAFTTRLLLQYEAYCRQNGKVYDALLAESIRHLPQNTLNPEPVRPLPKDKSSSKEPFTQPIKKDPVSQEPFVPSSEMHDLYKKLALRLRCMEQFKPQNPVPTEAQNLTAYCQELFQLQGNTLISCQSEEESRMLRLAVYKKATVSSHPVYLIESPDELLCTANYIDAQGVLHKGPGGPLYEFLKTHKNNTPTLLINYDKFKDSDFARFNSLLDPKPLIDGFAFQRLFHDDETPNSYTQDKTRLRVIGFRDSTNPDCYNESDFTSRMPNKRAGFKNIPSAPPLVAPETPNLKAEPIALFNSPYWKTELLGQWVPYKEHFIFKEGLLQKALAKHPSALLIHNGLESHPEYRAFWQNALTLRTITHQGHTIELPQELSVYHQPGYDWDVLKKDIGFLECLRGKGPGEVINPTRFHQLFKRYQCKDGQLIEHLGLLAEAAGRDTLLELYISRALSTDQWAKLLTEAKALNLKLKLYLEEGVTLPGELGLNEPQKVPSVSVHQRDKAYSVLSKEEAQQELEQLKSQGSEPLILDVSEAQASDLIARLSIKKEHDTVQVENDHPIVLEFEEHAGALIQELAHGKTVLLKGQIKPELMDELEALLQQRRTQKNAKGTLYVMPTALKPLAPNQLANFQCLDNTLPKDDISAEEFVAGRIKACNDVLKTEPYVFLSGLSGVGKTSFVEKEFCGNGKHTLHRSIESWLKATEEGLGDDQYHLYFDDEVNLNHRNCSEDEGLYNTPPTYLYQGKVYTLTSKHKKIYAGNPLSYGGGRTLASLFQEHGNAVVFTPLPNSFITDRILNPVFVGTSLSDETMGAIKQPILKVYNALCGYSDTRILISPREVQMMALLTVSYCQQYPDTDAHDVATHLAYQIAAPLVPVEHRSAFESFKPTTQSSLIVTPTAPPTSSFVITASRAPIEQHLNQLLLLRQQRQAAAGTKNEAQLYGGLGGLVLEGPPGVGKSELIIHLLTSWGFTEAYHNSTGPRSKNVFYRVAADWPLSVKMEVITQAFQDGAGVILDEINGSPLMEEFLNPLLMGKDKNGKPPKNPGFMLLGTQNPATLSGRRQASEALNRRLQTVQMPEYPVNELVEILAAKGVAKDDAPIIADEWSKAYHAAQRAGHNPPTFRELQRVALSLLQAKEHTPVNEFQEETRVHLETTEPQEPQEQPVLSPNRKPGETRPEIPPIVNKEHKEAAFTALLEVLRKKSEQLSKRSNKKADQDAARVSAQLQSTLSAAGTEYFAQKITYSEFSARCNQAIKEAKSTLETHRGWKQILGNIALFIVSIARSIWNGRVTFFSFETDSMKKVRTLQENINGLDSGDEEDTISKPNSGSVS